MSAPAQELASCASNEYFDRAESGFAIAHYVLTNVRFSNRPSGVKHFQTVHHCNVDVTEKCQNATSLDHLVGMRKAEAKRYFDL